MLTRANQFMLATITGALLATGCGSDNNGGPSGPPADGNTVDATPSLTFTPATLTISAGETVTFAFGTVQHNVFFDDPTVASLNIEAPSANLSVNRTFATAGTFTYSCHIHPTMHGTVVVQ
jgi:plastocyanin